MEYCYEVLHYIIENEPMSAVTLAEYFGWGTGVKNRYLASLRAWGWIIPRGRIESTEKGRLEAGRGDLINSPLTKGRGCVMVKPVKPRCFSPGI